MLSALVYFMAAALAQDRSTESLAAWRPGPVIPLAAKLHHVQGIEVEGDTLWVSSVDAKAKKGFLSRLERATGKLLLQVEVQDGPRIHPGGISRAGDSIWIPVAEYTRASTTSIQRRNKITLALEASFTVADHIGCLAVGPTGLLGGNWDSRMLYLWRPDGTEIRRTPNPHATSYQDLKFADGQWLGGGGLSRQQGAVDFLDRETYALRRRILVHHTDRGLSLTHEGVAYVNRTLYFLPEDDPSRLFVFSDPPVR